MKKSSLILVACMAMISCSNAYKVKNVDLTGKVDSLSFALGVVNGDYLSNQMFRDGVVDSEAAEMIDVITEGYNEDPQSDAPQYEVVGKQIGCFFASMGESGLNGNPRWRVDEGLLFQGLINGIYEDTVVISHSAASKYADEKMQSVKPEEGKALKLISAKCPTKVKPVKLKNESDSMNYICGFINGYDLSKKLFADGDVDKDKIVKAFAAKVNEGAAKPLSHFREAMMFRNYGGQLRKMGDDHNFLGLDSLDFNFDMFRQGLINGIYKDSVTLNAADANNILNTEVSRAREEQARRQAEEAKVKFADRIANEEAFLAENAKKNDIVVTESGLQYKVLRQGKGAKPALTDRVLVHYHGTLLDGTVFDSSVDRKQPIDFGVTQVIPGWTEVLQLMPVGSKYRVFIPYQLGYNDRAAGKIPPYSMLIFDVELLNILPPEQAPQQQAK